MDLLMLHPGVDIQIEGKRYSVLAMLHDVERARHEVHDYVRIMLAHQGRQSHELLLYPKTGKLVFVHGGKRREIDEKDVRLLP